MQDLHIAAYQMNIQNAKKEENLKKVQQTISENNRKEIAIQKTAKMAEEYRQQTELKRKETENKLEELEAEKIRKIETTRNLQKIEAKEAQAKLDKIQADTDANKIRTHADANSYASFKQAQDKKGLLNSLQIVCNTPRALKISKDPITKSDSFTCSINS